MRINSWWAADPAERFWMETTGRVDLGADLHAPQLNGAGRPEWGYALVAETRPGDVVFHWHKSRAGRPALVGWSVITGPLQARQYYTELGATAVEELGKPFDLIVHGLGAVRHVEVKGSTAAPLAAVELTVNEVAHAGSYQPTDLIVVDHIGLSVNATGEPTATGGRIRAWANWTPAKTALSPTRYAYEFARRIEAGRGTGVTLAPGETPVVELSYARVIGSQGCGYGRLSDLPRARGPLPILEQLSIPVDEEL